MTTVPTAAQADTFADSIEVAASLYDNYYGNGATQTIYLAVFTQNDSAVGAVQLPLDPTADLASASICRGLTDSYGTILVREYSAVWVGQPTTVTVPFAAVPFIPDDTEQTRVNDPANWLAAP